MRFRPSASKRILSLTRPVVRATNRLPCFFRSGRGSVQTFVSDTPKLYDFQQEPVDMKVKMTRVYPTDNGFGLTTSSCVWRCVLCPTGYYCSGCRILFVRKLQKSHGKFHVSMTTWPWCHSNIGKRMTDLECPHQGRYECGVAIRRFTHNHFTSPNFI